LTIRVEDTERLSLEQIRASPEASEEVQFEAVNRRGSTPLMGAVATFFSQIVSVWEGCLQ